MIDYRIASEADAQAIAALAAEIWREYYTPLIGADQVEYMLSRFQSEAAIAQAIANGTAYHLACDGESPVGYLALKPEEDHLFLSKIYILKAYRGHGIARSFVGIATAMAWNLNLPIVRLTVNKGNLNSIASYKHMGFTTIDEVVTDIGSGFSMDDYVMELVVEG